MQPHSQHDSTGRMNCRLAPVRCIGIIHGAVILIDRYTLLEMPVPVKHCLGLNKDIRSDTLQLLSSIPFRGQAAKLLPSWHASSQVSTAWTSDAAPLRMLLHNCLSPPSPHNISPCVSERLSDYNTRCPDARQANETAQELCYHCGDPCHACHSCQSGSSPGSKTIRLDWLQHPSGRPQ